MPLLDSDSDQVAMDVEDGPYRPRSGSAGIKDLLFRKNRHKSDVNPPVSLNTTANSMPKVIVPSGKMKTSPPQTAQPQQTGFGKQPPSTPTGKVKNIWNAIRPRSKSDAASIQPGGSRMRSKTLEFDENNSASSPHNGAQGNHIHNAPLSNSDLDMLAKSPPSGSNPTLMAKLQAGHLHASTSSGSQNNQMNPQEFVEAYRQRAYTDPKSQARAAALAKYKQKKREVMIHLISHFNPPFVLVLVCSYFALYFYRFSIRKLHLGRKLFSFFFFFIKLRLNYFTM